MQEVLDAMDRDNHTLFFTDVRQLDVDMTIGPVLRDVRLVGHGHWPGPVLLRPAGSTHRALLTTFAGADR